MDETELIFFPTPRVVFATNTFENIPVLLQHEKTKLLEVVLVQEAGFTTQFSIYHQDGTFLAKAVGSQLYATKHGEKAGVRLRHMPRRTVCELDGRTVFELERDEAAGLRTAAELYSSDGHFIKVHDHVDFFALNGASLELSGQTFSGVTFKNMPIGIFLGAGDPPASCCVHLVPPPELSQVVPRKVGRNEMCPCGSGSKYKRCHGK